METLEKARLALRKYILENKEQVKKDLEELRKKSNYFKFYNFTLCDIEYNSYNGFMFTLLGIDVNKLESSLFHLGLSKDYIYLQLLFMNFEIWEKHE